MTLPPDSAAYVEQLGVLVPMLSRIPECADYAEVIAEAALALRSDADGARALALLVAAVGWQETLWGKAKGHAGTTGPGIIGADGHGRGLMQIDDRAHPEFCARLLADGRPAWSDPASNIKQGSQILDAGLRVFPGNLSAGVAAYNAGAGAVRRALSRGHSPDVATTGGDYSARVLEHFRKWGGVG